MSGLILVAVNEKDMLAAFNVQGTKEIFQLPITNLYDRDGDETEDWNAAIAYVCGQQDLWITVEIIHKHDKPTVN